MPKLRIKARGATFYAHGTIAGQRVRQSLGTGDRAQATEICAQLEARLWKRAVYGEEAVRTFEEAAVIYLEQGGEGRFLPRLLHHFKGRAVATIKPGELRDAAITLYPAAAAATRNRQAIIPARAVINAAADMGWCQKLSVSLFPVLKSRKHQPVDRAWLNRHGEHIGKENGWFLWIGRDHRFMHIRHMHSQEEIIALVEALSGQKWVPDKLGFVPVVNARKQSKPEGDE